MAVNFYLNNVLMKVEPGTPIVETQDETLDQATFVLEFNDRKNAFLPMSSFRVVDTTTNETLNFVVINDSVEIVRKVDPLYKHTITLTQNTRKLSKQLLRNSDFTQPLQDKLRIECKAVGVFHLGYSVDPSFHLVWNDTATLTSKEGQTYAEHDICYVNYKGQLSPRVKFDNLYMELETKTISFTSGSISAGILGGILYNYGTPPEYNLFKSLTAVLIRKDTEQGNEITQNFVFENGNTRLNVKETLSSNDYQRMFGNRLSTTTYQLKVLDNPTFNEPSVIGDNPNLYSSDLDESPSVIVLIDVKLTTTQTYYYTLYDVLDGIEKQSRDTTTQSRVFTMPNRNSEKGQVLDSIIAPNFRFTECNVYEAVNKVFSYLDAIATLDSNGVLDFEYFNDNDAATVLTDEDIEFSDISKTLNEDKYFNKLVSNYQNGRKQNSQYFPAEKRFSKITGQKYGIFDVNSAVFKVNQKIDYVEKVYVKTGDKNEIPERLNCTFDYYNRNYPNTSIRFSLHFPSSYLFIARNIIDISEFVYSDEEYALLPTGYPENFAPNKNNVIRYSKNNNELYVGGTSKRANNTTATTMSFVLYWSALDCYYINTKNISDSPLRSLDFNDTTFTTINLYDMSLCVKYKSINDGRVVIEGTINKYDGEESITMSSSGTSLYRMGNNMLGLLSRMGNETYHCTLSMTSFSSRIKKGTIWVDDDNNKYIANVVKTTFSTTSNNVIVEVDFVKNFNLFSQFIDIDKEKRFYEISNKITLKGYENFIDYIYFSKTEIQESVVYSPKYTLAFFTTLLTNNFVSENNNNKKPDSAYIQAYNYIDDDGPMNLGETNGFDDYATDNYYTIISIPINSYGSGNMLCFEMGYDDPINAGDRIYIKNDEIKILPTLYCYNDGFADGFNFRVADSSGNYTAMNTNDENAYPLLASQSINDMLIRIDKLPYYKKPNEILHLNYEVALLPYQNEEIFFGREFIEHNALFDLDAEKIDKDLYVYIGDYQYSINDYKAKGTPLKKSISVNIDDFQNATLTVSLAPIPHISGSSWCIANANGDILIAVNQRVSVSAGQLILYIKGSGTRLS